MLQNIKIELLKIRRTHIFDIIRHNDHCKPLAAFCN